MIDLDRLEISFRTYNALSKAGYRYAEDLTCKTERHVLDVRGIGHGALREIREALRGYDLRMGMTGPAYGEDDLPEEPYPPVYTFPLRSRYVRCVWGI